MGDQPYNNGPELRVHTRSLLLADQRTRTLRSTRRTVVKWVVSKRGSLEGLTAAIDQTAGQVSSRMQEAHDATVRPLEPLNWMPDTQE